MPGRSPARGTAGTRSAAAGGARRSSLTATRRPVLRSYPRRSARRPRAQLLAQDVVVANLQGHLAIVLPGAAFSTITIPMGWRRRRSVVPRPVGPDGPRPWRSLRCPRFAPASAPSSHVPSVLMDRVRGAVRAPPRLRPVVPRPVGLDGPRPWRCPRSRSRLRPVVPRPVGLDGPRPCRCPRFRPAPASAPPSHVPDCVTEGSGCVRSTPVPFDLLRHGRPHGAQLVLDAGDAPGGRFSNVRQEGNARWAGRWSAWGRSRTTIPPVQ